MLNAAKYGSTGVVDWDDVDHVRHCEGMVVPRASPVPPMRGYGGAQHAQDRHCEGMVVPNMLKSTGLS